MRTLTLVLVLAGHAAAQTITPPPSVVLPTPQGPLDLNAAIASLHACYVYDQHGDNLAGAYASAVKFHTAAGTEIASLNYGLIWDTGTGIGGPMASLGLRLDNLVASAGANAWVKDHAAIAALPRIEVGPFGGYINRLGWLYGIFASRRLGN